jgi:hypothetical protein
MRIRTIKPSFWKSEDVAALSYHDRLLFIGLWNFVEDSGVGKDSATGITIELFPLDLLTQEPDMVFMQVSDGMDNLARQGLIHRYTVDGKRYFRVNGFGEHQVINKPTKGKNPLPPSGDPQGALWDDSDTTPVVVPEDYRVERKGKERKGKDLMSAGADADPPGFLEFYTAYPRKEAKGQARSAYVKALTKTNPQALLEGATRYAQDASRSKQFTKLPATWLNGECWDDDPLPVKVDREPSKKYQEEW